MILRNPLYVRADKSVYAYFQTMNYEIIDNVEAYDSIHCVFIHDNADGGKYVIDTKPLAKPGGTGYAFGTGETRYCCRDDRSGLYLT
ncbi:MAG: hypothetical protein NC320_12810 [Clostridium sp.]|nr:hypothetical protein [Clostridium sp.]